MRIKHSINFVLFALLISLLLILASCSKYQDHNYQTKTCDNGYVYFDNKCCPDSNTDGLCDSDEFKQADARETNIVPQSSQTNKPSSDSNSEGIQGSGDLSNFFDIFEDEIPIVIGEAGNAYEIRILNNFMSNLVAKDKIPPGKFRALIDTDKEYAQIKNQNHILFGTGCNNIRVKELIGDCTTLPNIKENEGMITVYNNVYLIIANNEKGLKAITGYIANNRLSGSKLVAD